MYQIVLGSGLEANMDKHTDNLRTMNRTTIIVKKRVLASKTKEVTRRIYLHAVFIYQFCLH